MEDLDVKYKKYLREQSRKTKLGAHPRHNDSLSEGQPLDSNTADMDRLKTLEQQSPPGVSQLATVENTCLPKSSSPSIKREGSRSRSRSRSCSPPKRAKARPTSGKADDSYDDFTRPSYTGELWKPGDDSTVPSRLRSTDKPNVTTHHRQHPSSASRSKTHLRQMQAPPVTFSTETSARSSNSNNEILRQPETKAITAEQLVTEVKGIYAGLVMVESKCIEVDNAQNAAHNDLSNKLSDEQWQALIALHRTYLNEHHDFFLASQHPAATPALRRLPAKYAMPARMWRHGIHSFLEVLRHRLPASYEHMISFIYLAYSMIALLFETVPAFEETWMECLGDLARYRMAIEDDDIRDREIWAGVSRQWYSKASDKSPTTGRLYHHLAILARPNAVQQLFYYSKSLCVEIPFVAARESIMTLFDPIMSPTPNPQQMKLARPELLFVRTHGILFCMLAGKQPREDPEAPMSEMLQWLDSHIARSTLSWRSTGYHMGLANICAIMGYGFDGNPISKALKDQPPTSTSEIQNKSNDSTQRSEVMGITLKLYSETCKIVLRRFGDPNILSFFHVNLVFLYHLTFRPDAMQYVASSFPWELAVQMLNTLLNSYQSDQARSDLIACMESDKFPPATPKSASQSAATVIVLPRPLPDDYALRGFPWVEHYFPRNNEDRSKDWFANDRIDDDEKYFEMPSTTEERKERCLWLGHKIAKRGDNKWLQYNSESHTFSVGLGVDEHRSSTSHHQHTPLSSPKNPGHLELEELPDATPGAP